MLHSCGQLLIALRNNGLASTGATIYFQEHLHMYICLQKSFFSYYTNYTVVGWKDTGTKIFNYQHRTLCAAEKVDMRLGNAISHVGV